MKLHLIVVLFAIFTTFSFGQKPSASPSPERTKNFGSSLKKYKNKRQKNFENKSGYESDDSETIRVNTDLVLNDVLVTDQNGKVITNLERDDFTVMEDDVPQTIEVFSTGENAQIPRSIVLIIDCAAVQSPYIKESIEAAKRLVDKLAPNDRMAVVTVDVKLRISFTNDKILLKKTLASLETKDTKLGSGVEFDALLTVLNEMFDEQDRRIIIFQGDGNEIIWLKKDQDSPYLISNSMRDKSGMRYSGRVRDFGFSDVKEAIERSRATIYSIVPGIRFLGFSQKERLARGKIAFENTYRALGFKDEYLPVLTREFQWRDTEVHTAGQTAMSKVAELSGGYTAFIEKPEDAENVYSGIFTTIENRYIIGYYPTNQMQDGKLRNIKIEVRDHPEYVIVGRKSYIAAKSEK